MLHLVPVPSLLPMLFFCIDIPRHPPTVVVVRLVQVDVVVMELSVKLEPLPCHATTSGFTIW